MIETALSPLDPSLLEQKFFSTQYQYTDARGERKQADVKVGYAFEPIQPNDDFILWSLLSLTLRHSQNHILTATPYWLLKQLGMFTGGHDYQTLRDSVERLSQLLYRNTGFYNPISQEHERWQFAFFATHLPESLDSDRLWKLVWNQPFIEASRATGGRLMFDLELFRKLGSPATRRLFLKLSDRFYRSNRVYMNVDDLTINGLGFAAIRLLKKRKYDLTHCIETLIGHGVLTLGRGQKSAKELFLKRGKGSYTVVFYRGIYFERPTDESQGRNDATHDPLYEPMLALGVAESVIATLLKKSPRNLLERWLRITEAAMKEKPDGFPGFKVSPAAFFVDGVLNERMPPDWMYQLEKVERRKIYAAEEAEMKAAEKLLAADYQKQRREALRSFLKTPAGQALYTRAYDASLTLWQARGEPQPVAQQRAADDAIAWTDRCDDFVFAEFPVWMLARQNFDS